MWTEVLLPFTFLQRIVDSCRSPVAQRHEGFPQRTFTFAIEPQIKGPAFANALNLASRIVFRTSTESSFIIHLISSAVSPLANIIDYTIYNNKGGK